jgi:MSHA pilin protein MshD
VSTSIAARHSPGFSLLEVTVASVLVGVLLVAAMRTIGASAFAQSQAAERATGEFLADGLMAEILGKCYQDPDGNAVFGPEPGESTKKDFDDVDDYQGWSESPPQFADGTAVPGFDGWTRRVSVVRVDPANPGVTAIGETGAKQITVIVEHRGITVSTRIALRTEAP